MCRTTWNTLMIFAEHSAKTCYNKKKLKKLNLWLPSIVFYRVQPDKVYVRKLRRKKRLNWFFRATRNCSTQRTQLYTTYVHFELDLLLNRLRQSTHLRYWANKVVAGSNKVGSWAALRELADLASPTIRSFLAHCSFFSLTHYSFWGGVIRLRPYIITSHHHRTEILILVRSILAKYHSVCLPR